MTKVAHFGRVRLKEIEKTGRQSGRPFRAEDPRRSAGLAPQGQVTPSLESSTRRAGAASAAEERDSLAAVGRCYFEIQSPAGSRMAPLEQEQSSIGRLEGSDVVIPDPSVSALHAIIERYGDEWVLRDLGSTNGTFVNGERIVADRRLRPGDEVRIGTSRLIFRSEILPAPHTMAADGPPDLTRRERDVLIALCRPMANADVFTPPASTRQIAEELFVTEATVKAHLISMYDKFSLYETEGSRRVRLAQEAVRRRAVSLADLR